MKGLHSIDKHLESSRYAFGQLIVCRFEMNTCQFKSILSVIHLISARSTTLNVLKLMLRTAFTSFRVLPRFNMLIAIHFLMTSKSAGSKGNSFIKGLTQHANGKLGWRFRSTADNALRHNPDVLVTCKAHLPSRLQNGTRLFASRIQQ